MALPKIMLVTTDRELAKTAKAALGGAVVLNFTDSGEKALKALGSDHGYTAVMADMVLKGVDGQTFLTRVADKHPKVARIAVTDGGDFELARGLINAAGASWILSKPCRGEELRQAITGAVARTKPDKGEGDAVKETLVGCVKMLVDIMGLFLPEAVARSKRIRDRAQQVNRDLKALSPQLMDMAVLLANIGCVGLPRALLKKMESGTNITKQDLQAFRTHPAIAARLLRNVPRLGKVSEIIRHQNTPCSQGPPLGARILKACLDMDQMQINGGSMKKALHYMRKRPEVYEPAVIDALGTNYGDPDETSGVEVAVADLRPGMIMVQDMVTEDGTVLLHKGDCLSEASHLRLTNFNDLIKVKEPLHVVDAGACPASK